MECCVSTDVGTWTNWLTFELDPDYSTDAGTGWLSPISYKRWYAEFYVGDIPRTRIGGMVFERNHGFKMVLFTEAPDILRRRYITFSYLRHRSGNVVDSLSCRRRSFRRLSSKSACDCMRKTNIYLL